MYTPAPMEFAPLQTVSAKDRKEKRRNTYHCVAASSVAANAAAASTVVARAVAVSTVAASMTNDCEVHASCEWSRRRDPRAMCKALASREPHGICQPSAGWQKLSADHLTRLKAAALKAPARDARF